MKEIYSLVRGLLLSQNQLTLNATITEIKGETNGDANLTRGKTKENGCYRNRDEIKSV